MKKISMTTVLALALAVAGRAESVSDAFCEALNVSGLTFTTGGDAAWTVTTENAADGVSALQSGVIGHSQSTWFQTTIEGPRLISFMVMVSSEGSCDPLVVSVDGNERLRSQKDISWSRCYVYVDEGSHVVRWTYQKDGSVNRGEDLARIDQLELSEVSEEITFPSGLKTLENYAICGSRSLKSVVLPTALTSIHSGFFSGCTGLTEIKIPNTVGVVGDSAFYGCSSLQAIDLPNTVSNLGSSVFYDCRALKTAHLPANLATLKSELFRYCSSLESVTLPVALRKIEEYVFYDCGRLSAIDLPETLTEIKSGAFYDCSSLMELHLPASMTEIADYLFCGCSSLRTVTYSQNLMKIGTYAFSGCAALSAIEIPAQVASIGPYAFRGCSSLVEVHLPAGINEISSGLFSGCSSLKTVTCSENLTKIGSSAFSDCSALTTFAIPAQVTEIPNYCFSGCQSLTEVAIPEGVTRIGERAFDDCQHLKTLVIPSTVQTFYESTDSYWAPFHSCSGLQLVEFKGPPPDYVQYSTFNCRMVIPKEYGAAWFKVQGINNFSGYANGGVFTVEVISSNIRENDPTVMDVVYKVTSSQPTVKVRALAFEDGERSFAKVIRPETFIDGTAANVGDSVTANEEHTISWRVSSDWQTRLAKLQVEVFACEGELLPLELMTIPASDAYGKMKVTWNALSESQWLDALYWLYASKDAGLTLEDGVLKETSSGGTLVSGTSVTYATSYWTYYDRDGRYVGYHEEKQPSAPQYVFGKMGYTLIESEVLTYVNDELRLGLSPNGARQYGYKIVP